MRCQNNTDCQHKKSGVPMKKILILFFAVLFSLSLSVQAKQLRLITLKDGSTLKGSIESMQNGSYQIKTDHLGTLRIQDTDIVSIQDVNMPVRPTATQPRLKSLKDMDVSGKSIQEIQSMPVVQNIQTRMLSDPEMMTDLQRLMQDEEFVRIITDPQFMQGLINGDPNQLGDNPKFKYLMSHPDMMRIIEKMYGQNRDLFQ
jgi:hypothetical protein